MRKTWRANDLEYFEAASASALMFHDLHSEGKQSGIEITRHVERVAANGDLRLAAEEPLGGGEGGVRVARSRGVGGNGRTATAIRR